MLNSAEVFYKPYESQGEAWPITFNRLIWGIMIFQIFMTGIFLLKKGIVLATLMIPLLVGTLAWSIYTARVFKPLSKNVNLSSVFEVQRGEESEDVIRMRAGHPVSWSQRCVPIPQTLASLISCSHLNHRRYGMNDETLYVAPEDEHTDYVSLPSGFVLDDNLDPFISLSRQWQTGIVACSSEFLVSCMTRDESLALTILSSTGKRRYGHPALSGVLPQPWLPLKKGQTLVNRASNGKSSPRDEAVVLTLRKRFSTVRRKRNKSLVPGADSTAVFGRGETPGGEQQSVPSTTSSHEDLRRNPWLSDTSLGRPPATRSNSESQARGRQLTHRLSFDEATGIINLPEDMDWLMEDVDDSDSDVDYGSVSPSGSGNGDGETATQSPVEEGDEVVNGGAPSSAVTSTPVTSPTKQRHGTYYHHPEKRRQPIPGAFPRSVQ